jgi:hypothetical protein
MIFVAFDKWHFLLQQAKLCFTNVDESLGIIENAKQKSQKMVK